MTSETSVRGKWQWLKRTAGVASATIWIVGLAGLPEDWRRWMQEWLPVVWGVLSNPNVTAPLGALAIIWAYDEVRTHRRLRQQMAGAKVLPVPQPTERNSQDRLAQLVPDILEARDQAEESQGEAISNIVRLAYHLEKRFGIPCPDSPRNVHDLDHWYWFLSHLLPMAETEDIAGATMLLEEEPWY